MAKTKPKKSNGSLWKGPEVDGITQSMLSLFISCRERFRVRVVEGWKDLDQFRHRIEYGQMWHLCEEHCGSDYSPNPHWKSELKSYAKELCRKYPLQQEQIDHWYNVCKVQFPIYRDYWHKRDKRKARKSVEREGVFSVPYKLPSGRTVLLRGKRDGLTEEKRGLVLDEHKTKGEINEELMQRQLLFDLQVMFYSVAITEEQKLGTIKSKKKYNGVQYNVVRRPLAGGKFSIRQKNGQSTSEFYQELSDLIQANPEWFFMRWDVVITPQDINRFKVQFLHPVLEQLCDWWEHVSNKLFDVNYGGMKEYSQNAPFYPVHYRTPYGIYNPVSDTSRTPMDDYLDTGSTIGLQKVTSLFGELK